MTDRPMHKSVFGGCVMALAAIAMLVSASAASAVKTDLYDVFTACPTGAPEMNDPGSLIAVCAAGNATDGQLTIGDQTIPLSHLEVQFGTTGITANEPDCPQLEACLGRVPGTTTVAATPSKLVLESSAKRNRHHRKGNVSGKGRKVKLTLEGAGDIRAVSPAFIFGAPIPLFTLPVKLHVEAPGLGGDCYIGSEEEPIFLSPFVTGPPTQTNFQPDPNGFHTEFISLGGMPTVDSALTIPEADGCGEGKGLHKGSDKQADELVNAMFDLPSPAGENELSFSHTDIAFLATQFDGTPPDGGAELQAALEAAK